MHNVDILIVGGSGLAGGAETFNARLKQHLTKAGYEVTLASTNSYLRATRLGPALARYVKSTIKIVGLLRRQQPQHVLVSCANFFDILVAVTIVIVARPHDVIVVPHFNRSWRFWRSKICVSLIRWLSWQTRFFSIAPNQAVGFREHNIRVEAQIFPNFFDYSPPAIFSAANLSSSETFVALYVGRSVPEKRVDKIAQFLGQLAHEGLKIELNLVGDVDYTMKKKIFKFQTLCFKVNSLGYLDSRGVSEQMQIADAFVSFSTSDTLPLTFLEAAAHGLPVITIDNPVTRDVAALTNGVHFVDPDRIFESELAKRDIKNSALLAQSFKAVIAQHGQVVIDLIEQGVSSS